MTPLVTERRGSGDGVPACPEAEVRRTVDGIAGLLLRTFDERRTDRLWPADYTVFATNPLSVAYGACGPALLLGSRMRGGAAPAAGLPPEVAAWMLGRPLDNDTYPPGLYVGLAGIAWAFHDLGWEERGEAVMTLLRSSPLLYDDPSVFLGVAGWGLASLRFHARTGRQLHLDRAVQAGEHLLRTAEREGDTCSWRSSLDGLVHYGYGYGASGIALFLLHLHLATGEERFRSYAVRGLEFDLGRASESSLGLQWQRVEGDPVVYPYWIHGGAGVGSVLVRFHQLLGDERYGELARRVADDTFVTYSYAPGLFEGLAGIGEFMLDMYRCTGDEVYRDRASAIARTVLWFRVEEEGGIAFPGRWLNRIAHDYATGSAGIGMFLSRLVAPGERAFVDL
ncbi:lanthionine synthetase C family protein [Streptomyces sp. NRRL F-5727]|uniref:lanthionine synthetase C family protein n=1 Tax=Streptomyces sp. NRRL F-5727 TaxID=1463871 RepID=UPI0004C66BCB|nr:lanthionine synthetase C family protein [Streptomyces sp. NRRL F-5727]